MGLAVADLGPPQDGPPDVISEVGILPLAPREDHEDALRSLRAVHDGLGLLKALEPGQGRGKLAAHVYAPSLAVLGRADPALADGFTDEDHTVLEIDVGPLQRHRFPEAHPGAGET